MSNRYIFSSESVGEGHPDKVADTISDAVLDACLTQDKYSRVACETYVKSNMVIVGGEITTKANLDFVKIARQSIQPASKRRKSLNKNSPARIAWASIFLRTAAAPHLPGPGNRRAPQQRR